MKNFKWKLTLIIVAIVLSAVMLVVFAFQGVQNKAISYEEQIRTADSDVKVQEKRRADLIPNLVDCVKAYDKHEYKTLVAVVDVRGTNTDDAVKEIQTMVNAVAEAYPELKSNANYQNLMNELSATENLIANHRMTYNDWVRDYNKYVRKFPNKQVLGMVGYETIKYTYLNYETSSDSPTDLFGE